MKLPKIQNQRSPGRLAFISADVVGREYAAKISGLSRESKAKLSAIVESGKAERQAMVSAQNLESSKASAEYGIARSEAQVRSSIAGELQGETSLDQKTLQLEGAYGDRPVAEAKGEVERIKKDTQYQQREFARQNQLANTELSLMRAESSLVGAEAALLGAEAGIVGAEGRVEQTEWGMINAGLNVFKVAVNAFVAYDQQESQQQQADFNLQLREVNTTFDKAVLGKESFAFKDVPEEVTTSLGIKNDGSLVPAYKVVAEWRRFVLQEQISELSGSIEDGDSRANAVNVAKGWESTLYSAGVKDGIKAGPLYIKKTTLRKTDEHMDKKNWSLALATVSDSSMTIEEKRIKTTEILNKKQNVEVNDVTLAPLTTRDANGATVMDKETKIKLDHQYERLLDKDPSLMSHLTTAQYESAVKETASRIKAYEAYGVKEAKAKVAHIYMQGGLRLDNMKATGKDHNRVETAGMIETLKKSPVASHKKLALDLTIETFVGPEVQKFNSMNGAIQAKTFASLDAFVKGTERDELGNLKGDWASFSDEEKMTMITLRDRMETNLEAARSDPVKFMKENGLAEARDFNPGDVTGTVKAWDKMADKVEGDQGQRNKFTEDYNYDAMNDHYAGLDVPGRMKFVTELSAGVKDDPQKLMALVQPMKELNNPILAMVVERIAEGDHATARAGIRGSMKLQNMPEAVDGARKEITMQLNQQIGNAYSHNSTERNALRDFALALYADSNNSFGQLGVADNKDLAAKAVNMIAKDIITYNEGMFLPPTDTIKTFEDVNNHMDSITPGYLAGVGGAYSEAQVLDKLRDGTATLEAIDKNEFVVKIDEVYVPSKANSGVEYRFNFREPMMTVAQQEHIRATQPDLDPVDVGYQANLGQGMSFFDLDSGMLQEKSLALQKEADVALGGIRQMATDAKTEVKRAFDFFTQPIREASEEGIRKARMAP